MRKTDDVLARRALVRGLRAKVRYELANAQDRLLNEIETDALERFDRAVVRGEDYESVAASALSGTIDVRGVLSS